MRFQFIASLVFSAFGACVRGLRHTGQLLALGFADPAACADRGGAAWHRSPGAYGHLVGLNKD
jgi:hypothetical protein